MSSIGQTQGAIVRSDLEVRQDNIKMMAKLDPLVADLYTVFNQGRHTRHHQKMHQAFTSFQQAYILWMVESQLLVRDPDILFDVLKDSN
jgi:hypothetical protein